MAFPGFRSWSPSRPDFFLSKADHARSADDSRARAREREEHWFLATLQLSPCCNMSVLNAMTVSFQSKKLIIFVFFLIKNKLLGRSVSADNIFWFVLFCFVLLFPPFLITFQRYFLYYKVIIKLQDIFLLQWFFKIETEKGTI